MWLLLPSRYRHYFIIMYYISLYLTIIIIYTLIFEGTKLYNLVQHNNVQMMMLWGLVKCKYISKESCIKTDSFPSVPERWTEQKNASNHPAAVISKPCRRISWLPSLFGRLGQNHSNWHQWSSFVPEFGTSNVNVVSFSGCCLQWSIHWQCPVQPPAM